MDLLLIILRLKAMDLERIKQNKIKTTAPLMERSNTLHAGCGPEKVQNLRAVE